MAKPAHVPLPSVRRLSLYLRQLEAFDTQDRCTISSKQLGQALDLSDAQVRKDLAYFGQFGHPGIGYRVHELIAQVRRILGTDKTSLVLLVGVGNLGRALLAFRGFPKRGFEIVEAFDNDAGKIGRHFEASASLNVRPLSEMAMIAERRSIRFGILTVPAPSAQSVADLMVAAGIRGILNFAPVMLQLDSSIAVSPVDLGVHLEQLSFQLTKTLT